MPFDRYTTEQIAAVKELLGLTKDGAPQNPPPKRSELTFKDIADRTGVSRATVGAFAGVHGIKPPAGMRGPRPGAPGAGRPKGPGKKLGQRSPHRRRARELKGMGLSLREIAEQITIEVREAATSDQDREFTISRAAIAKLTDEKDSAN